MVDAEQGLGDPRGIEETPNSIGHPYGEPDPLTRKFQIGEDVPSPVSAVPASVVPIAEIEVESVVPEIAKFGGTDRTSMKDIDILKDGFTLMDEYAWLSKPVFMDDKEIKSGSATLGNVMSLTMPPTPVTERSSANSMADLSLYLDTGASRNAVFNPALLINRRDPPTGPNQFEVADGAHLTVIGYGDIEMENFRIPGVYLVRGLTANLISVGHLATSHKVWSCFAGNECNLTLSDGTRVGGAIRHDDNQYLLRFLEIE